MHINLAAPESRLSLPCQAASVGRTSPRAQHEPLTMKQKNKCLRDLDMDEGPQQRKRHCNDVSILLLYGSTYLITLSRTLHYHHRLLLMLPLISVMRVTLCPAVTSLSPMTSLDPLSPMWSLSPTTVPGRL